MYDHVLMKLPEDVVMSVRALISDIEADPVKQATSYLLIKNALLTSFGKTKWQMACALLDHPDLGDRRPTAMMAEMLSLRFETSAPVSLFLALFLHRLPSSSIRDHLAAADHKTATEMGKPCRYSLGRQECRVPSTQFLSLSPLCLSAPHCLGPPALLTAAPGHPIAAATPRARNTGTAPPPHLAVRTTELAIPIPDCVFITASMA
jgi:hypothetical protein